MIIDPKLPFAEDIKHYWQTSRESPDTWLLRARKQIERLGGNVLAEGFGSAEDREAYMLGFEIDGQKFKIVWPVLPSKKGNTLAARRQAATMLYHDVKAKSISASVLGTRKAFFSYLLLPDGRAVQDAAVDKHVIDLFRKLLTKGD